LELRVNTVGDSLRNCPTQNNEIHTHILQNATDKDTVFDVYEH